jgi:DNA repair exonuclease SbcCD ATPase subunit
VDEPEFLDEAGIGQFVATINSLRGAYPQLLVVSHIEGIKNSFPHVITVTKNEEGISHAEVTGGINA